MIAMKATISVILKIIMIIPARTCGIKDIEVSVLL